MLDLIILILIVIALIIHRYLSIFWEQGTLPYAMGFLMFSNIFLIIYFLNFVWMFGLVVGIIITALTFFQIVFLSFLWPFLLPKLISVYREHPSFKLFLKVTNVNSFIYSSFSVVIIALGLLTIINFFVSHYALLTRKVVDFFNGNIISPILWVIGVAVVSNAIRILVLSKLLDNDTVKDVLNPQSYDNLIEQEPKNVSIPNAIIISGLIIFIISIFYYCFTPINRDITNTRGSYSKQSNTTAINKDTYISQDESKIAEQKMSHEECFNLGINYYYGTNNYSKDVNKAFGYFKESAEQGNPKAQFLLGICYFNGQGVIKNYAEAFRWLLKSANQGEALAMYESGQCYYYGDGIEQNYKEAFKWFLKAAEQNIADAQYMIGYMHYNGQGVAVDKEGALYWLVKSAQQNNLKAEDFLNKILSDIPNQKFEQNTNREIVKLQMKAAELGYAKAEYNLGYMYANGLGITQDYVESHKWLDKAVNQKNTEAVQLMQENKIINTIAQAKLGYFIAEYELGRMYEYGENMPQDYELAYNWYSKAAEQESSEAKYKLGYMYEHGMYVNKNIEKAVEWYTKASELDNKFAQYILGLIYYEGRNIKQDYEKASKWLQEAADNGDEKAKDILQKDDILFIFHLAQEGHTEAQYKIGEMYYNGDKLPKSYPKALYWFSKSANQDYAKAQTSLGNMYYEGIGVEQNYRQAFEWYMSAAKQGDAHAQYIIGCMYISGEGVAKDNIHALDWLSKSATQGNQNAQAIIKKMNL